MAGPIVRWGAVLGLGAVWWWAVLRLALTDDAGLLEGAVAAGGWGLSLLPVHCVPKAKAEAEAEAEATGAAGTRRRWWAWGVARAPEALPSADRAIGTPPPEDTGGSSFVGTGGSPSLGTGGSTPLGTGGATFADSGGSSFADSGGWPFGHTGGPTSVDGEGWPFGATKASPPRRSGGGSDPS
ncbi:hypothetical protein ABZV31_34160 [Streptomyces sp. NPDC005202]|uniref:hypothetical protein n=1 Tax=Streptomyces sp. NPDC005202 TaxID=3157021 RepID=UPI0033BE8BD2